MWFLSCLPRGVFGTEQTPLANPQLRTLPQPVSDIKRLAEGYTAPRLHLAKTFPYTSCRPIEDEFPTAKRSQSFPSTIGRSLKKLGWMQATPELRIKTRDSENSMDMETPYGRLSDCICAKVFEREKDQPWRFLGLGKELLRDQDVEELEAAIKSQVEWKDDASSLTTFVLESAPQLFAMIVYNGPKSLLKQFCDKKMGDASFPVKVVATTCIESTKDFPSKTLDLGTQIRRPDTQSLLNLWQHVFFFPKLCWSGDFEQPPLGPNCNIPFLAPLEEKHRTEFSIVYKGIVDRDHIDIDSNDVDIATESINGTPHPRVSVKQLLPIGLKKEDAQDFVKAEHEMLNLLRDFESPHLIKTISFYKTPGNTENLHYVFPWAEQGSLRKFWAEKTASIRGDNDVIWVFSQLLGLADAIQALHKENYRHGDLKPENILCFKVPGSRVEDLTSCVLVISDVGLSRIYDRLTQLRTQTKMAGGETKAYAAPETTIFPKRPTSRRYDIWSLGCLYLEFIIWVLYGFAELDRFRKDLKEFGGESGERFCTISDTKQLQVDGSTQFVAEVNQVVKAWIEHIKMDSRCAGTGAGTAFGHLIVLVEEQLLVVNANPTRILGPNKPVDGSQAIAASRKGADIIPGVIIQPASTIGFNVENPKTEISQTAKLKQSEENERATASEVYKELNMIVRKGKNGSIEWLHHGNGLDKVSCKGPESMTYLTSSLSRASLDKSDDYKFKHDDKWEYVPDENAAQRLKATLGQLDQQHEPSQLCDRCSSLSLWSQDCSFYDTARNLARNAVRCALCLLLSQGLKKWSILADNSLHFFRIGSFLKFNNKLMPPIVSLYTTPEAQEALRFNVQLGFPELPDPGSPKHIEVIRQWVQDCDVNHQCLRYQDQPFLPTRLIYVGKHGLEKPRLISNTERLDKKESKYLALSHRWGAHTLEGKIICTYRENITGLEAGFNDSELPPKYLDAIAIARGLEVDYLWIDSLCIIQKDSEDWKKESERMEKVFRFAYATVAASCASSTAEKFLKKRPERQSVTMKANSAYHYVCEDIDDFSKEVEQGELNRRGWVFQERALSRRTIYFTEKQTYWECGNGVQCETLTKTSNSKASLLGDSNFPYSMPDFVKGQQIVFYQDLYKSYTELALTFIQDRPVAIRGLETRLISALKTKGKFGVFHVYLRRGLLWQRGKGPLKPISFSDRPEQEPVPSWSWMAYEGDIQFMKVPFGEVEWDQWAKNIVSPWENGQNNNQIPLEIEVLVHNLRPVRLGRRVFLDEGELKFGHHFKCVIVGSSKTSNQGEGRDYYVLIVTPLSQGESHLIQDEVQVFKRAGVAFLQEHHIMLDKSVKAYLR